MFSKGHIYYFSQFKFNNGNTPKDKYFIVLKETEDKLIIGTLPTRTNKIPSFVTIEHGCINIEERMYNCYLFRENQPICTNNFCFDLPTFIYGDDIEYYDKQTMIDDHPTEGVNFVKQGELSDIEFKNIVECFCKSNAVKAGIKRQLAADK